MSRLFKNIRTKKSPLVEPRIILINRIIRECLNESFDTILKTDYEMVKDGVITIYRFKTNSNNYYDLEFISGLIDCYTKTDDGGFLSKYFLCDDDEVVKTIDVAFVPSEINIDDRDNHELYTKETNRGEQFELMGRISFLVKEFIKNNPKQNIFVIGKNSKEMKLKIYNKMFDNIFSQNFIRVEGENPGYDEGCFYLIKKNNFKK